MRDGIIAKPLKRDNPAHLGRDPVGPSGAERVLIDRNLGIALGVVVGVT